MPDRFLEAQLLKGSQEHKSGVSAIRAFKPHPLVVIFKICLMRHCKSSFLDSIIPSTCLQLYCAGSTH